MRPVDATRLHLGGECGGPGTGKAIIEERFLARSPGQYGKKRMLKKSPERAPLTGGLTRDGG
jgi:hypothetical protein